MDHLTELENKTIYLLRESYYRFKDIALLWSIGKDSTTLLWLARKAFFGTLPFPVIHLDTTFKFKEIYEFRDRYSALWGLDLIVCKNIRAITAGASPRTGKFECCNALKTDALKLILKERGLKALLLAIRRDEHGIRAKERYFSSRNAAFTWDYKHQPAELWDIYKTRVEGEEHLRIHPMLHWTELDVWRYIERERIPVVSLYFAQNGRRYRSIGCQPCCTSVPSNANSLPKIIRELETTKTAERSGRAQDKEDAYTMQKLRSLGYM